LNQTDTTITKDTNQTFTQFLANGNYNWSVKCFDSVGLEGANEVYNLSINYSGTNWHISTEADLEELMDGDESGDASPGDTIIIADGIYPDWGVEMRTNGGPGQEITIRPNTSKQVTFTNSTHFVIRGTDIVMKDFVFEDCDNNVSSYQIVIGGSDIYSADRTHIINVDFLRSACVNGSGNLMIFHNADYVEIDNCLFNESTTNNSCSCIVLSVQTAKEFPKHSHIHHNIFSNNLLCKTIAVGSGINSGQTGEENTYSIIEYNQFINLTNIDEGIMDKSSSQTIRYNNWTDCKGPCVSLRGGDDTEVYGNIFDNVSVGIRINGIGNKAYNNIIYHSHNCMVLPWGTDDTYPDTGSITPQNSTIVHNTCIAQSGDDWGISSHYYGDPNASILPKNNEIKNNIFYGDNNYMIHTNVTEANNSIDTNLFDTIDDDVVAEPTGGNAIEADAQLSALNVSAILMLNFPAIDSGTDVNLTQNYAGNPIYGTPD
ncbi:MAG: hypothetical protein KAQ92_01305, partial [Candidatus Aenigmarchaeota archaeon]|nr:hypothetical protein [Candidatus Aenigmarchaeota archaeon]